MDLLIFDLDGTLVDSKQDLANAVNAARAEMGLDPMDEKLISTYVGDGAPTLIRRAMPAHATEEVLARTLEFFLRYYGDHKLDCTRPYPGVEAALEKLARAGVVMAVLTNKPVRISRAILEGLGLARHFARIYGGNSFEQKKPHPVGVETLLAELGVARERALLVGDSAVDVRTARHAGLRVCGVTYGFQPESLTAEAPDLVVDSLGQLVDIILGASKA